MIVCKSDLVSGQVTRHQIAALSVLPGKLRRRLGQQCAYRRWNN